MGIKGAAIATSCGYIFQTIFLAILFFRKRYRAEFGTCRWQLNGAEFLKCFRVGFPQGIFIGIEIFGWAIFYWMMTSMSKTHITVSSICQSLWILFSFFGDGLSRGVTASAGNLIGSKQSNQLLRVMKSALILQILFIVAISVILLWDSRDLIRILFFEHQKTLNQQIDSAMMDTLRVCLILAFMNLLFEGIRWVFGGLLIAAGDTLFLLISGSVSVWVGMLLPIYLIVVRNNLAVEYAWLIACMYSLVLASVYALRYKQGAWKKIDLISDPQKTRDLSIDLE
jgi:MATE family multidrug resistance protein